MCTPIDLKPVGYSGGYRLTAWIEQDYLTSVHNFDIYSKEQIQGWQDLEWHFVTLHVEADLTGIVLGDAYHRAVPYGLNEWDAARRDPRGPGVSEWQQAHPPLAKLPFPWTWAHEYDLIEKAVGQADERLGLVLRRAAQLAVERPGLTLPSAAV